MKHLASLFAALCLVAVSSVPSSATLVAMDPSVDNNQCLKLLFTDKDAHAKLCGGPFEMDKGTEPLVKGGSSTCVSAAADMSLLDDLLRVHVADNGCAPPCAPPQTSLINQPTLKLFPVARGEVVLMAC